MARGVRLCTLPAGPHPAGPPTRRPAAAPPALGRARPRTSGPWPGASATNYTLVAQKPPKSPQILATSVRLAEMPAGGPTALPAAAAHRSPPVLKAPSLSELPVPVEKLRRLRRPKLSTGSRHRDTQSTQSLAQVHNQG